MEGYVRKETTQHKAAVTTQMEKECYNVSDLSPQLN